MHSDTEEGSIIVIDPKKVLEEAEEKRSKGGRPTDAVRLAQGKRSLRPGFDPWPEEKKIEVVTLHQAGMRKTKDLERMSGVPINTINYWKHQDWWLEMTDKINAVSDFDTVSQFNQIVESSLEAVQDRIINGDFVYNSRTGEVARKPVSGRDAAIIAAVVVDKRQLLRGKPTSLVQQTGADKRLAELATEFKKFIGSKEVKGEVITYEVPK